MDVMSFFWRPTPAQLWNNSAARSLQAGQPASSGGGGGGARQQGARNRRGRPSRLTKAAKDPAQGAIDAMLQPKPTADLWGSPSARTPPARPAAAAGGGR